MQIDDLPSSIWRVLGVDPDEVTRVDESVFDDGTGAASDHVRLIVLDVAGGPPKRLVRKSFRPLTSGRHALNSTQIDHWAYWRRELTAYGSGVLPNGPRLRAPRLLAVEDDELFCDYVGDRRPSVRQAAAALASWHASDRTDLDLPWLADDQLAQRLAVTDLDWAAVDLDPRLAAGWARRDDDLARLVDLPRSIAHGDFGIGNLRVVGDTVVAIDWATLGASPVGLDCAQLALSVLDDSVLVDYLDALGDRYDRADVELGYRTALSLIGASRAHWMASRSLSLPDGYAEFVGTT